MPASGTVSYIQKCSTAPKKPKPVVQPVRYFVTQRKHMSAAECVDLLCAWITQDVNPDWLQLVGHCMGEEDRAGHNMGLR